MASDKDIPCLRIVALGSDSLAHDTLRIWDRLKKMGDHFLVTQVQLTY